MIPFWFILITILWMGFFVLEGFDFGVGILHGVVGRDEAGSRAAVNTIGPLWDGNEVWLIVAAAAMFAAFPAWYATMFSGFYMVVVVLLVALILRGVSFEYRGKRDSARWRRGWDAAMVAGSLAAPFLIGLMLGSLLHGVPVNARQEFTGSLADVFSPYGIYAGLTLTALCVLHGATFLALKTSGAVRHRAVRLARLAAPAVALIVTAYAAWTHAIAGKGALLNPVELAAVIFVVAAAWLALDGRDGWAFAATTITMAASVLAIFTDLYPRVLVSSTSPAFSLTAGNTASGNYSLKVMTIVAVIALPFVLAYQGWTYYVFRRRISPADFGGYPDPARQADDNPGPARQAGGQPRATALAAGPATAMSAADPQPAGEQANHARPGGGPEHDGQRQAGEEQADARQAGVQQAGEGQAGDGQAGDGQAGDGQASRRQADDGQASGRREATGTPTTDSAGPRAPRHR
ncbi:MAG TPA: cytochrome d ubiquinol oxidase subunit II [Streptosporangiaceae bacterium]|nr:cytochrome d ubiquinol oxidase subunit II [Streptosporangiaceae bacterium]